MNLGRERFEQALIVFWPEQAIAPLRDPFTTPNYRHIADAYDSAAHDLMALHIFFLYVDKQKAIYCRWLYETARSLANYYRDQQQVRAA